MVGLQYLQKTPIPYINTLRVKCPYSKLFWSVFSSIRIRITANTDTFYAVIPYINNNTGIF